MGKYMDLEEICETENQLIIELFYIMKRLKEVIHEKNRIIQGKKCRLPLDEEQDDLRREQIEEIEEQKEEVIESPSIRFDAWQDTSPEEWSSKNFIGFYAYQFLEYMGYEDPELQRNKIKASILTSVKRFMTIRKIDYENYIKWCFNSLDKELKWVHTPSIQVITSDAVYKSFLSMDKKSTIRKRRKF